MVTAMPSERRTTGAFALFEYGYRPFFLLAALHAAVVVPVWVAAVFGWLALLSSAVSFYVFDPRSVRRHSGQAVESVGTIGFV
jgi:hypothetical protein